MTIKGPLAVTLLVLTLHCWTAADLAAQSSVSHVAAARAVAYKPGQDFTWVFSQNCTEVVPPQGRPKREPSTAAKVPPRSQWYYGEPVKVFDNLYYVGTQLQSMWAITTSEGIILHDTAYNYMIKDVEDGMKKVGLDPKQIKYVIVSHAHTDHYLGARYLQDTYHPHVIMSEADWKYMEKDFAEKDKTPGAQMPIKDIVATDGMKLTLGDTTLTLYVTPGHTPGTISTLIPVKDGNQKHLASLWGGSGVGYEEMVSAYPSYLESVKNYAASAKRYKEIVTRAGADVYLSSHTVHDKTLDKLNALRFRLRGDPHPFVSKDAVSRHLTLVAECAEAQVAWWAARASSN
jgi:metallo-beta-lactamase class B